LRAGFGLAGVFAAQAVALVVYGVLNASAIMAGAWFGPVRWSKLLRKPQAADSAFSKDGAMLAP